MKETEKNDDDITLFDYIRVLGRHKALILFIIMISVTATAIISFRLPQVYESKAVIIPAAPQNERSGMGALAMQFGIAAPSTSNVSEMLALLRSNIIIERVIMKHNLVPLLSLKDSGKLTDSEKTWRGIKYFRSAFMVKNNMKDGVIELSMYFRDPAIATDILNQILIELTDFMSGEAKRVAETNQKYLESLIDKNPDPLIRQKIYSLVAQQIETAMMAEVKENFAFKILDPPRSSPDRIKPTRKKNVVFAFVLSSFFGIFAAFVMEYYKNSRKKQ